MKFRKFFALRLTAFASILFSLFIISATVSAQSDSTAAKLSFNNFIAAADSRDAVSLMRPRIVTEPRNKVIVSSEVSAPISSTAMRAFQLERRAFDLLNQKRMENGLPALMWSDKMAMVARLHSQEMAQFKFFSHASRDGKMVDDRADSLGFKKWKAIGENIAYNRGYENPADFACERWMLSPSHRDNVLSSRWKEAGIGVAIAPDGTHYFTEVFITPR